MSPSIAVSCQNLLRAFRKNHATLLSLISADDFDTLKFTHLMTRRDQIVEEIVNGGLPELELRQVYNEHQMLQTKIHIVCDELKTSLANLGTGTKALTAYR